MIPFQGVDLNKLMIKQRFAYNNLEYLSSLVRCDANR